MKRTNERMSFFSVYVCFALDKLKEWQTLDAFEGAQ